MSNRTQGMKHLQVPEAKPNNKNTKHIIIIILIMIIYGSSSSCYVKLDNRPL